MANKWPLAIAAYAALGTLIWFTLEPHVFVGGQDIPLRGAVLALMGLLCARTLLHCWRARAEEGHEHSDRAG